MDTPGADNEDDDLDFEESTEDGLDGEYKDAEDAAKVEEAEYEENEFEVREQAPVRITPNPADPTPEERARHDATHLPFGPWCLVCVEARATEDPHYRPTFGQREHGLPQVCVDYCEI